MGYSGWAGKVCVICLLCAATTTGSQAQTFTTLVNFAGRPNGSEPLASLVQGTDGNYYGTTSYGGDNNCSTVGCGTVFRVTGAGTLTTLYSFCAQPRCIDGSSPAAGLVLGSDGNFYGTTAHGGFSGNYCLQECGTVFRITPQGRLTTLHRFGGPSDGYLPTAPLIQASDGDFYGTTNEGGTYGLGTVFKITPGGEFTTLHIFGSVANDSAYPEAALLQASDGNFYGTASSGGDFCSPNGFCGTIFQMTSGGTLTTVYNFCAVGDCSDGDTPTGALVQASDGNLISTTSEGGVNAASFGTVFEVTPGGTLTTLHQFCTTLPCADGNAPVAGLIQATDGNFYGTTSAGGVNKCGVFGNPCGNIFSITPTGTLTTLFDWDWTDGGLPYAALIQGTNGNFYGTTGSGGAHGAGTIFELSTGLGPFVSLVGSVGKVGQVASVLGEGFTATTGVSFNGTPANFKVISDTYLKATVPAGATTGFVTITTPSGTLTSNQPFQVTP